MKKGIVLWMGVLCLSVLAAVSAAAFGTREVIPPEVWVSAPAEEVYISPAGADGIQDRFELSFSATPAKRRVIKAYRLAVLDSAQSVVYSVEQSDPKKNRKPLALPDSLAWDGTLQDGSPAPEGRYTLTVEARDNKGVVGSGGSFSIVLDNTSPTVTVSAPYTIFSPNADGNQDILVIEQDGSPEVQWKGMFLDAGGAEVAGSDWSGQAPPNFTWDGRGRDGKLLPDGTYSYLISATDLAGNSVSKTLEGIVLDARDTPISLTIDAAYFSPNSDGVLDTVSFTVAVGVSEGIKEWSLRIMNKSGATRREYRGEISAPGRVSFDGRGSDGAILVEGVYKGLLEVVYLNGNRPTAESPSVELDLTPPSASAGSDLRVFSPNGDGNKDTVSVSQTVSEELEWTGTLRSAAGEVVQSFSWKGKPENRFVWAGLGSDGQLLPDGVYTYQLQATDRAGNTGSSRPVSVELDTEETEVLVSADTAHFSPNSDAVKDLVRVTPQLRVREGVEGYELLILDAKNLPVRTFRGAAEVPKTFSWDGADNEANPLPDGSYLAEFRVRYAKGDYHAVRTAPFVLDNQPPTVQLSADYILFSPDSDGRRDTLTVKQSSSREELWEAQLLNAQGASVRSFLWNGTAQNLTWDGNDESGNRVADGTYTYRVSSTDRAGNRGSAELRGIRVDTRATPVAVNVSDSGVSPNGDGVKDTVNINLYATVADEFESWTVTVLHATTREGKSFSGGKGQKIPASLVWDGRTGQGSVKEGPHVVTFRVVYSKGNIAEARSPKDVLVDITGPQIRAAVSPQPFSPDGDGVDDRLTISLEASDPSSVESWKLSILDPAGHEFTSFAGKGSPQKPLVWDGRSSKGELVEAAQDYTAAITVRDVLGNAGYGKEMIPVDVLVVREGDKLKIRISSIQFAPNSADFNDLDPVATDKDRRTLKRLAEILNKYSTYRIAIEGHGVLVYWENPAKATEEEQTVLQPLSAKRAETVKKALVALGIEAERITTVGLGGSQPIVPHGDLENRWKNRRVEFILIEESR